MKKADVSARKVARQAVFALGCFVFILLVGARGARAESAPLNGPAMGEHASPRKVERFELFGTLGYGVAVGLWAAGERELDPYGVTPGLDFGYTWPFGLRIGTDASYGFGRSLESTSRTGNVITTHASSFTWGASFGYDFLLSSFTLRGAIDGGLVVYFDEGDAAPWFYVGPKVALIWQYRAFEFGLQTKYLWAVPSAIQVGLMGGTRF
jgi:hypothetical protein